MVMTKLVNCGKLSVPKKFNEAVASIVCENSEYVITLNDGFKFEWDSTQAIEHSQKSVLETIKTKIVFPSENAIETENVEVASEEISVNEIQSKLEMKTETIQVVEVKNNPISIEEQIKNQFDERIKAKIVFEFLVLGNKPSQIEKKLPNASQLLEELYLTEEYRGNFSGGLRNGAIIGTLKRHGRFDLVKLFEIHFYGLNNNIQRFKNNDGIPA